MGDFLSANSHQLEISLPFARLWKGSGQDKQPPPPQFLKTQRQSSLGPLAGAPASFCAAPRASYGLARPWRSAAVGPKRPGHDETMTSGQNDSFGFVSARSRHRWRHQSLRQGKRSTGELKSPGGGATYDKRHSLGAALQVRQVPRAGFCLRQFGVGWRRWPPGRSGDASRGSGPAQARAPTLLWALSGRLRAWVSSSLKKQKGWTRCTRPRHINDRLPLRAPTSHSGRVQRHYLPL